MDRPPPDPAKLLSAWMEWERGETPPGRVMSNLKTGGLRDLLEALAAQVPMAAARPPTGQAGEPQGAGDAPKGGQPQRGGDAPKGGDPQGAGGSEQAGAGGDDTPSDDKPSTESWTPVV